MAKDNTSPGNRIRTIDILRALTMFLMIFVNDLWSLTGVPKWLEHTAADTDGMGFSDIIFPLFLFIVGLSVPLAIDIRFRKKESIPVIGGHIASRTVALLVMGFYMVNFEVINPETMGLNKYVWEILMAAAIFLLWTDYKRLPVLSGKLSLFMKTGAVLILGYLAWIYRGGTPEHVTGMQTHWWGILGLIGWAYLFNSLLYLFAGKRLGILIPVFFLLLFMNVQESGYFESLPSFRFVVGASNHVLVLAGVLCTVIYLRLKEQTGGSRKFLILSSVAGFLFVAFGFLLRPEFPISKIYATPSWTTVCIGISLLSYVLLYVVIDQAGFYRWAKLIKPAGTSTLTCYLMPYFIYPIFILFGFDWTGFLSHGIVGIVRSLLFSLAIIVLVGWLEKKNIRLKI